MKLRNELIFQSSVLNFISQSSSSLVIGQWPSVISNLKENGEGGIRTHGGVTPTPVFETGLFNRSSTSPRVQIVRVSDRQPQPCFTARSIFAIVQGQRTPVRLGNLTAQNKTDAGAAGFRGEKRNEQVRRIRKSRAIVLDEDIQIGARPFPAEARASSSLE